MNDLGVHLALFLVVGIAVVVCGACYSETDDKAALKQVPRRLAWFVGGCAILAAVVLVIEHTVARVS